MTCLTENSEIWEQYFKREPEGLFLLDFYLDYLKFNLI